MACIAVKTNGNTCGLECVRRNAYNIHPEHLSFCALHAAQYGERYEDAGDTHHVEGMCLKFMPSHRWCSREAIPGEVMCATHHAAAQRAAARARGEEVAPPAGPHFGRPFVAGPKRMRETPGELARIVRDTQNVHATAVTKQTSEMEKKILAVDVPIKQKTELIIATAWLVSSKTTCARGLACMIDTHRWFNTRTCRSQNDYMYRQILRGVVAKINLVANEDTKRELFDRLYEECVEAVGMCCEGHISRLCNVFVGFDDEFVAPVAVGELAQNKMAAISVMDVPVDEKKRLANAWFDEAAVPQQMRADWLGAF